MKWRLPSEEMPESNKKILMTVSFDEDVQQESFVILGFYHYGHWESYLGNQNFRVIAWMPAPEPYKK